MSRPAPSRADFLSSKCDHPHVSRVAASDVVLRTKSPRAASHSIDRARGDLKRRAGTLASCVRARTAPNGATLFQLRARTSACFAGRDSDVVRRRKSPRAAERRPGPRGPPNVAQKFERAAIERARPAPSRTIP